MDFIHQTVHQADPVPIGFQVLSDGAGTEDKQNSLSVTSTNELTVLRQ